MDIFVILTISFIISINILFFIIGILFGKIFWQNTSFEYSQNHKFLKGPNKSQSKIDIDNTKIVTDIKTDGLEKKYEKIAETKQSNDNISSSINKLKSMKG